MARALEEDAELGYLDQQVMARRSRVRGVALCGELLSVRQVFDALVSAPSERAWRATSVVPSSTAPCCRPPPASAYGPRSAPGPSSSSSQAYARGLVH